MYTITGRKSLSVSGVHTFNERQLSSFWFSKKPNISSNTVNPCGAYGPNSVVFRIFSHPLCSCGG